MQGGLPGWVEGGSAVERERAMWTRWRGRKRNGEGREARVRVRERGGEGGSEVGEGQACGRLVWGEELRRKKRT